MKKSLLLAGMLSMGIATAQTGKVGINTENPNETLEINGTLRVDNLPESGVGTIYDGAETAKTTFTGTRTLVADEKGNVGYTTMGAAKQNFPVVLVGGNIKGDAIPQIDYTLPVGEREHQELVIEETITLDKKSLVHFDAAVSIGLRSFPESDRLKRITIDIMLDGEPIATNGLPLGGVTPLSKVSEEGGRVYVSGVFSPVATRSVVLEPGTYKVGVRGRIFRHSSDTDEAITIRFGGLTNDYFDVVAYPLEP